MISHLGNDNFSLHLHTFLSLSLIYEPLPTKTKTVCHYLELVGGVRVEVDLAKVVTGGHEFLVVGTATSIHICAVSALWPDSWRNQQ